MPDEDSTLATQTQQSSTTQTGDDNDFVLDFWEGETMQEIKDLSEIENENILDEDGNNEAKEIETEKKDDMNFDQNDFFGSSEGKKDENVGENIEENKITDENSDDFALSFDNEEKEDKNNPENSEDDFIAVGNESREDITEDKNEEKSDIFQDGFDVTQEIKQEAPTEISGEELFEENDTSKAGEIEFDSTDLFGDGAAKSEDAPAEESENQEVMAEVKEEPKSLQNSNMENIAENSDLSEDSENNAVDNNSSDENKDASLDFDLEFDASSEDENKTDIESEGVGKVIETFEIDTEKEEKVEDKNSEVENKEWENLDFVMDYNPEENSEEKIENESENKVEEKVESDIENNGEEQKMKQPEISDFLWNTSVDFSNIKDVNESEMTRENNIDGEVKSDDKESADVDNEGWATLKEISWEVPGQMDLSQNIGETSTQNTSTSVSNDNADVKEENQNLEADKTTDVSENKTLEESQAQEVNNVADAAETQKVEVPLDKNVGPVETPEMKATLSLDQILDSELNNNPQFSDNSTAVPTNVQASKWLFGNKKMVVVVMWVCILFVLVFVLAFPSWLTDRKPWDVAEEPSVTVQTWDSIHPSSSDEPVDNWLDNWWDISWDKPSTSQPTVIVLWDDDPDSWDGQWEDLHDKWPVPYVSDGSDQENLEDETKNDIPVEEVISKISSFKSQAESYYSLWDDRQDKQLIRYAVQALNLCDKYQEELEGLTSVDAESFSSFQAQVKAKISEMEAYIWGPEDVEVFRQSNFRDEYNFTGKDENLQYIYSNK